MKEYLISMDSQETFTKDELRDALGDLTTWNYALRNRVFNNGHIRTVDEADDIVGNIMDKRQKKETVKEEFTFTETELREAYKRIGHTLTHTSKIIDTIKAFREPDYPVGTVVLDADGNWWKRHNHQQWVPFGDYILRDHDVPKRPLTVKS